MVSVPVDDLPLAVLPAVDVRSKPTVWASSPDTPAATSSKLYSVRSDNRDATHRFRRCLPG